MSFLVTVVAIERQLLQPRQLLSVKVPQPLAFLEPQEFRLKLQDQQLLRFKELGLLSLHPFLPPNLLQQLWTPCYLASLDLWPQAGLQVDSDQSALKASAPQHFGIHFGLITFGGL